MSFSVSSFWRYMPPVVKNILIINIILFIATFVLNRFNINLYDILGMHYWQAGKFNIMQLVSYMFMHGSIGHIFFNMFALFMFGGLLERTWGARRFLLYYMVTGIGAGIIQQIIWTIDFKPFIDEITTIVNSGNSVNVNGVIINSILEIKALFNNPITVGASGSVFGVLLAFGWLFPQVELYMLFIPIPIKARLAVAIYAFVELFFGVANFSWDNIAHFAHLGGMLFGAILIVIWRGKKFKV